MMMAVSNFFIKMERNLRWFQELRNFAISRMTLPDKPTWPDGLTAAVFLSFSDALEAFSSLGEIIALNLNLADQLLHY